ncbi:MAG: hypothetical protein RLZZ535_2169, partial [Cyanobacteriota bacterium]
MLVTGATIPVIAVTQGIVQFSQRESFNTLKKILATELKVFENEIDSEKHTLATNANTLALSVELAEINLNDADNVTAKNQELQSLISGVKEQQPNASFYLITDKQGKTVAQYIQAVKVDGSEYPLMPAAGDSNSKTQFQPVQLKTGISLTDVPIVSNALKLSRPLSGFEVIPGNILQRIGLERQANIGLRFQKTEGLAEPNKPYPEGKYDIDGGKAGFVVMAVEPIKLGKNQVGTAVVGTLVNRNFELVDRLKNVTNVSTATI